MLKSSEIACLLSSDCFLLAISKSYSTETTGILIKRFFICFFEFSWNFLNYDMLEHGSMIANVCVSMCHCAIRKTLKVIVAMLVEKFLCCDILDIACS